MAEMRSGQGSAVLAHALAFIMCPVAVVEIILCDVKHGSLLGVKLFSDL